MNAVWILITGAALAGIILYFVEHKGLKLPGASPAPRDAEIPGNSKNIFRLLEQWIESHWQLIGYLFIGTAGALLVPVVHEVSKGLPGLQTGFCDSTNCSVLLLLFSYGLLFGLTSGKILKSIPDLTLKKMSAVLEEQKQILRTTQSQPANELSIVHPPAFKRDLQSDYYDKAKDDADKKAYYKGINLNDPANARPALSKLLLNSHIHQLPYKPAIHLYADVDIHPTGELRSIYSGEKFSVAEMIRMDEQVEQMRVHALKMLSQHSKAASFVAEMDMEALLPYNCEHVVPQSWFDKAEPMRGDLHHLFTCESKCNSFRSNHKYHDFPDYLNMSGGVRDQCGKMVNDAFEPFRNKGVVARAVLYFLLRYPGKINNYTGEDINMLIQWHNEERVSEYELHRNQVIYKKQGNRNPFIDHPEIAEKLRLI